MCLKREQVNRCHCKSSGWAGRSFTFFLLRIGQFNCVYALFLVRPKVRLDSEENNATTLAFCIVPPLLVSRGTGSQVSLPQIRTFQPPIGGLMEFANGICSFGVQRIIDNINLKYDILGVFRDLAFPWKRRRSQYKAIVSDSRISHILCS